MDFILHRLAIGNAEEAWARPPTITAMLDVAEEIHLPPDIRVGHKVPIADMRPIPERHLAEAVDWLAQHIEEHRILVFCNAGVGRSTSVVVAYLCLRHNLGFGEAVEFVARKRPYMSILPNLFQTIEALRPSRGRSGDL